VAQSTIKTAYGFDPLYAAGLTGKGQHIAIATYDGFHVDNVKKFYSLSNLKPQPSVDQVAFNGDADYSEGSAMETELDAEFTGMIAPGASVHVFASATNDDAGELQMFTAILDDNRAQVANYSWGSCESGLDTQHVADMSKVFARAVAQGVNIMVASGDSGSDSCQDGSTVADWPAAATNVVAVGGTTFAQNNGAIAETGWDGSGGGISSIWELPQWQNQLGSPYMKRSYPDVSFNADPSSGQAIWTEYYGQAGWMVIGGTSMAAPQWSGFMALVGEARHNAGKATLGFLNPIIYGLSNADRAQTFHDVTSGNNGAYTAGAGWDAVTGLGSMQADTLLKHLSN
jgi:kumamolisin